MKRAFAFGIFFGLSIAASSMTSAQTRHRPKPAAAPAKPAPRFAPAPAPAAIPAPAPAPASAPGSPAGPKPEAASNGTGSSDPGVTLDGGSRAPVLRTEDDGGGAVDVKILDGGTRVFRFGEVEVEGRIKSPHLIYFLRRVRAEFAARELGHRSFMNELSHTREDPAF